MRLEQFYVIFFSLFKKSSKTTENFKNKIKKTLNSKKQNSLKISHTNSTDLKIIENKNNSTTFLKKFGSKNVEDISVELMGFNGHYGDVTGTGESANQTKKKQTQ